MKILMRILKWTGITLVLIVIGLYAYIQLSWDRKHDVALPDLKASKDSAVIAHGEYLVFGPAHCADCHIPISDLARIEAGEKLPLIGGHVFKLPFGDVVTPNITPDPDYGIGNMSDGQLARALRYNVAHTGMGMVPFMAFQHMSDEDVVAVISYLRSREPVRKNPGKTHWTLMGKAVWAFGLIKPDMPTETVPKSVKPDTTAAYGKYLANGISNCKGCHTARDMKTGAFTGPLFAGGMAFPSEFHEGVTYVSPNITPDAKTGVLRGWTEQDFIDRFRQGRLIDDSPMPWTSFAHFSENDLKALYRFLCTLEPVQRDNGPAVVKADK